MEKRVIVIVGPTASGKTNLGIEVAKKLNSEIISADSRQFYRLLDIGTAKPTESQMLEVKHHFIDNLEITENYDVSKFESEALQTINEIQQAGKIPIIVGGSGLYIKSVIDGLFNEVGRDEEYREQLLQIKNEKGNEYLFAMLQKVDTISAAKMLPQNWKRIMRALEVFHLTNQPIWKLQTEYKRENEKEFHQFGINWEREVLYQRIENRVDIMISSGLIDEVQNILKSGIPKTLNSLNTVGYKEIIEYLEGKISVKTAIELIKRNTRRFAKRQVTWFNVDKRIRWITFSNSTEIPEIADNIVLMK